MCQSVITVLWVDTNWFMINLLHHFKFNVPVLITYLVITAPRVTYRKISWNLMSLFLGRPQESTSFLSMKARNDTLSVNQNHKLIDTTFEGRMSSKWRHCDILVILLSNLQYWHLSVTGFISLFDYILFGGSVRFDASNYWFRSVLLSIVIDVILHSFSVLGLIEAWIIH